MKWIKKNKFTLITMIIFVLLTFTIFKIKEMFFPDQKAAIYGDRLDGKVKVDQKIYDDIKVKISENEKVEHVTITEAGRRIDIIITIKNDVSKEDAKKLIDPILSPFNESQIGYYDFQVFIKKTDSEQNDFPIIAYKQHNNSSFSWTKDREKEEAK